MADTDGGRQAAENFSHNLKTRREAIGMSQEHLAEAMNSRGFSFGQATVWKIESGQRGVSLTEGLALVEILSDGRPPLDLGSLTRAPNVDEARQALESANAAVIRANAAIEDAVASYIDEIRDYAAAYALAVDRTPADQQVGAIWDWADPQAPEMVALQARLQQSAEDGNSEDAVMDDVIAFEQRLEQTGWPWQPWRPEDFTKVVPGDGEHLETPER